MKSAKTSAFFVLACGVACGPTSLLSVAAQPLQVAPAEMPSASTPAPRLSDEQWLRTRIPGQMAPRVRAVLVGVGECPAAREQQSGSESDPNKSAKLGDWPSISNDVESMYEFLTAPGGICCPEDVVVLCNPPETAGAPTEPKKWRDRRYGIDPSHSVPTRKHLAAAIEDAITALSANEAMSPDAPSQQRDPADGPGLLLLYFCCHGVVDRSDGLTKLALADASLLEDGEVDPESLTSPAMFQPAFSPVAARRIHCIQIIDACHAEGANVVFGKDPESIGRAILVASRGMTEAFTAPDGRERSRFTWALTERRHAPDPKGVGYTTFPELHQAALKRLEGTGEVVIPAGSWPGALPEYVAYFEPDRLAEIRATVEAEEKQRDQLLAQIEASRELAAEPWMVAWREDAVRLAQRRAAWPSSGPALTADEIDALNKLQDALDSQVEPYRTNRFSEAADAWRSLKPARELWAQKFNWAKALETETKGGLANAVKEMEGLLAIAGGPQEQAEVETELSRRREQLRSLTVRELLAVASLSPSVRSAKQIRAGIEAMRQLERMDVPPSIASPEALVQASRAADERSLWLSEQGRIKWLMDSADRTLARLGPGPQRAGEMPSFDDVSHALVAWSAAKAMREKDQHRDILGLPADKVASIDERMASLQRERQAWEQRLQTWIAEVQAAVSATDAESLRRGAVAAAELRRSQSNPVSARLSIEERDLLEKLSPASEAGPITSQGCTIAVDWLCASLEVEFEKRSDLQSIARVEVTGRKVQQAAPQLTSVVKVFDPSQPGAAVREIGRFPVEWRAASTAATVEFKIKPLDLPALPQPAAIVRGGKVDEFRDATGRYVLSAEIYSVADASAQPVFQRRFEIEIRVTRQPRKVNQ